MAFWKSIQSISVDFCHVKKLIWFRLNIVTFTWIQPDKTTFIYWIYNSEVKAADCSVLSSENWWNLLPFYFEMSSVEIQMRRWGASVDISSEAAAILFLSKVTQSWPAVVDEMWENVASFNGNCGPQVYSGYAVIWCNSNANEPGNALKGHQNHCYRPNLYRNR